MNSTIFDVAPAASQLKPHQLVISLGLGMTVLAVLLKRSFLRNETKTSRPPMLRDMIPYVFNTYQLFMRMDKFLARAAKPLKENKVLGFHLGLNKTVYLVGSPDENIQTVIKSSPRIGFEPLVLLSFQNLMGFTPEDMAKFTNDRSGRLMSAPNPGTEDTPPSKRYWARFHTITHKYLANMAYSKGLVLKYHELMDEWLTATYEKKLAEQSGKMVGGKDSNGWVDIRLVDFMKEGIATASTKAIMGNRVFEIVPDILARLWDYDSILATLFMGPKPKWLFRDIYDKGEAFITAGQRFYEHAVMENGWDDPDATVDVGSDVDWEPSFGSRFFRKMLGYLRTSDLDSRSAGGMVGTMTMTVLNVNSVPVTTWAIMELACDPQLCRLIQEEVETTYIMDGTTSKPGSRRRIDVQKVVTLPRLESLYLELLRLHICMNLIREVIKPGFELSEYSLPEGSLVLGNTELVHLDESVWGRDGHPASEFWAERHLEYVEVDSDKKDPETGRNKTKRGLRAKKPRPNEWLPYGGGITMCPGRHFARQEIMLTIAMVVSEFEFEFVEWLNMDGTKSKRPAEHDLRYLGAGAVSPDRDMRMRWRRRW